MHAGINIRVVCTHRRTEVLRCRACGQVCFAHEKLPTNLRRCIGPHPTPFYRNQCTLMQNDLLAIGAKQGWTKKQPCVPPQFQGVRLLADLFQRLLQLTFHDLDKKAFPAAKRGELIGWLLTAISKTRRNARSSPCAPPYGRTTSRGNFFKKSR